jgi:hypothetical protein
MTKKFIPLVAATLLALPMVACEVHKTQEGEMPDVKVEGGQVPKYDVDPATVEVKPKETTVTVPDVNVSTKEKTITVPDVNVKAPGEADNKSDGSNQ